MNQQSLTLHTPAKLNLFLEILGKRDDGYHELETLMVTVNRYDTIRFREDDSGRTHLSCYHANGMQDFALATTDNLVYCAAELLRKHVQYQHGVAIELVKRIPAEAGLAGGSSDAAATLVGLNKLWQLNLSQEELTMIANQLGSDIAFFLAANNAAICTGRGELIEPVQIPSQYHFVIVKPTGGLATKAVYQHYQLTTHKQSVKPLLDALQQSKPAQIAQHLYNALQQPAEELSEEVSTLKQIFSKEPCLGNLMSGSGTAYFGICPSSRVARSLAARFRHQGYEQVFITRSLAG